MPNIVTVCVFTSDTTSNWKSLQVTEQEQKPERLLNKIMTNSIYFETQFFFHLNVNTQFNHIPVCVFSHFSAKKQAN